MQARSNDSSNRREFLTQSGLAVAAASLATPRAARGAQAEHVRLALVGCGGQGRNLAQRFSSLPSARFAYFCDPDQAQLEKVRKICPADQSVSDFRRALDDPAVDAVAIATPDHWHAPAAILAMRAGKHVYVEKPCSHNFREAMLLVETAQRTGRVVQHGTQTRSDGIHIAAMQALRAGLIGDVLVSKAWNVQRRGNIGHMQASEPPPGVDYDMWIGPAPFLPYQANRFHGVWRWWFNFGSGDMGNDGVHELDIARWGLGVDTLPTTISGIGGKYFFDDDQEFPDTMTVSFEYPGDGAVGHRRMLIYEQRLWSANYPQNVDNGVEFYGTKGRMFISKRGKLEVRNERNEVVDYRPHVPETFPSHAADFIASLKGGHAPNASAQTAFLSSALSHLGNISVRLGRSLRLDRDSLTIIGDEEANVMLGRAYRADHWAIPKSA